MVKLIFIYLPLVDLKSITDLSASVDNEASQSLLDDRKVVDDFSENPVGESDSSEENIMEDDAIEELSVEDIDSLDQIRWHLTADEEPSAEGVGTLLDLVQYLQAEGIKLESCRFVAILKSEQALCRMVELPPGKASDVRQALPYLIEDSLVVDVDEVHIANGSIHNQKTRVCVVSHDLMQYWTDMFDRFSMKINLFTPDIDLLLIDEDELLIVHFADRVFLRSVDVSLVVSITHWHEFLAIILNEFPHFSLVRCCIDRQYSGQIEQFEKRLSETLTSNTSVEAEYEIHFIDQDDFSFLISEWLHKEMHCINLLQGSYLVHEDYERYIKHLKFPFILSLAWAFTFILLNVGAGMWFESLGKDAYDEARVVYKKVNPNDKSKGGLVRKINALSRGESGQDTRFFQLLNGYADAIQEATSGDVTANTMVFDSKQGELVVEMIASKFESIDALHVHLKNSFDAKLGSIEQKENEVYATVRIK